jgi:hypothetical protein
MSNTDFNKILSTVNTVTNDYNYLPDPDNLICIDTSNNRIGINTLNPSEAIDVSGGRIKASRIILTNLPISDISLVPGELWNDNGTLKISTGS